MTTDVWSFYGNKIKKIDAKKFFEASREWTNRLEYRHRIRK